MRADPVEGDGRRRKGARRRGLLLDAAVRVIGRDGIAAVTQRAVAKEADLPPSAVTYYFATIDDLLVATLTKVNDTYINRLEGLSRDNDRALEGLAELITAATGRDRLQIIAEYELYLMAARRPDVREELNRWARAVEAFAGRYAVDPIHRSGLAAAIDGLCLRTIGHTDPPGAADVLEILRRLIAGERR